MSDSFPESAEPHCLRQLLEVNNEKKWLPKEDSNDVLKDGAEKEREEKYTWLKDKMGLIGQKIMLST